MLNQNNRLGVTFNGNYMKQNKLGYVHGSVVNICIVYSVKNRNIDSPDLTVQNGLFGGIKITKDVNTSQCKYFGYGICFDGKGKFSIGNITNGKNVLIFGVSTSSSIYANNKLNNIYVLGRDIVQRINGTTLNTEKIYQQDFTAPDKKFVLILHYNDDNSYLFVNGAQELKFKSAISYKDRNLLCLGNISSDWSLTNSTRTGLYVNVYDFDEKA